MYQPQGSEEPRSRVLVVDDEQAICSSLAGVLRDERFETLTVNDGAEALKMIEQFRPAIVFLDIWMPGLDGMETLEKIKQLLPATEVIMISGHATINNALEAMRRGAFDLIEKPFAIERVVSAAARALEHRKRLEETSYAKDSSGEITRTAREKPYTLLPHQGFLSSEMRGKNLGQRTLRDSVVLYGQCLHSGMKSGLVLEPLPPDSGIHFCLMGGSDSVPVFIDYVESTDFATTLRYGDTVAATIEHLMAVLHAYRISNLLIKCNGEVPIFDGSARQFCSVIESVGLEEQGGEWYEIAVEEELTVSDADGRQTITLVPDTSFSVRYELCYPSPVGRQEFTFRFEDGKFPEEVAPARTFGFMKDIEKLQRAGLAAGGRLDNFILIGPEGVVNTELRFENELCRHKVLDAVGDFFLIGRPLRARLEAKMTGHSDNIKLVRQLRDRLFTAIV